MYKVLLIGLGNAGLFYEFDPKRRKPASHYGGIKAFPDELTLVGVCDIDKSKKFFLKKKGIDLPFFEDYKEAIDSLKPDIVTIASWTKTHEEIFTYSLKKGVKGIILEKPIARNLKEADRMKVLWEKKKIPVVVNHERRWDTRYEFLKESLYNGRIGVVKTVYGRVLLGKIPKKFHSLFLDLEGGGPLLHDGTHMVDILFFLFEDFEIKDVFIEREGKLEKRVIALLYEKSNEIPIFIEIGGERDYFHFSVEVEGTKGKIVVGNGISELYEIKESRLYTGFKDLVKVPFPFNELGKTRAFDGPYYEILKALYRKESVNSDFSDGYRALKLIEELYKVGGMRKGDL